MNSVGNWKLEIGNSFNFFKKLKVTCPIPVSGFLRKEALMPTFIT
jgi:hypothetical protein